MTTLFDTTEIGSVSLPNRLAVAPMTRISASETGVPGERMTRYYGRFARGGFGLILTEGTYTDEAYSQGNPFQPGLANEEQAQAWRQVVDAVHAHGAAVFVQLMHAGALTQFNPFRDDTIAPSAFQPVGEQMPAYFGQGPFSLPREASEEDLADAIAGFAHAAGRAVRTSGFDGIEIHGANGYLIDQFLSAYTNSRTDRWGGVLPQRLRLALEVIRAVRAEVGETTPVGIRISQGKVNDFHYKWEGAEADAQAIFSTLDDAGVDFIHVTEYKAWQPAFGYSGPSLAEFARKYAPNCRLIVNGGLEDMNKTQGVLNIGADVVSIGKAALANPDFPKKIGDEEQLRDFDPDLLAPNAQIKDDEVLT